MLPLKYPLVVVLVDLLVDGNLVRERALFLPALAVLDELCAVFIGPVGGVDAVAVEEEVVDSLSQQILTSTARHAASSDAKVM